MNTVYLVIISALIILAIISLIFGVLFFIKYSKTRKSIHLVLGIILTFIVPGLLIYLAFKVYYPSIMIEYMPSPDSGMVYMPSPF